MSQDPSSSEPGSDPTAAPPPDSAYAPPPSWTPPASPAYPADEPRGADPTQGIDTSAATAGDPGAPYRDSNAAQAATPYGGYGPAQFGQPATARPDGSYGAPGDGSAGAGYGYTAPNPGGYAAPGYDTSGAGSTAYGAAGQRPADPGAAYGGYPDGHPAAGSPPAGYGTGYPPAGYPAGGYGGPAGGYGGPGYPQQPYAVAPPTNTMAILSLVFAFVFPPLGIVFGFVARGQIKRTGEQGEGLALAGLIISAVLTLLFVVPFVALIFFAIAASAGSVG